MAWLAVFVHFLFLELHHSSFVHSSHCCMVLHGKPSVSSSWAASVLAEQAPQRTIHDDSATTPQLPAAQMLLSTGCSELLCWRSLKPTGSSVLKALWAHAGSGAVHKQQVGKLPFTNEWQSEHFSEAANCSPCAG